jgi:alpha-ketoglutaric semialdehyde dehydrogenase
MPLTGRSFLGGQRAGSGATFRARDPRTGEQLNPEYSSASPDQVDRAARLAEAAFLPFAATAGKVRGRLLREVAARLEAIGPQIIERAALETALPAARLQGELQRTGNQLRLFAEVVEEGSWVNARIDSPLPGRTPAPRPDLRSMLRPLGPIAVFGASNFPLAFSVAGGDTASALAAGNPVVVKAHPAHPGASELAGEAIAAAVQACDLPEGVFSLLFDSGIEVGRQLVQHPSIKAVGFTGSLAAGRALMDLAAQRPDPIPCFTEMSSTNPVFILPRALRSRGTSIAAGLHGSITLGGGQFCTKPGLIFVPEQEETGALRSELERLMEAASPFTLLTEGIAAQYSRGLARRSDQGARLISPSPASPPAPTSSQSPCAAAPALFETTAAELRAHPDLGQELFGPGALLVRCASSSELLEAARELTGHLTATLIGDPEDLAANAELIRLLEQKAGRLIFNGYPTGVEVCHSMVHGGPYPATSDSRFTSVGSMAIFRFARPVCYQGFPDSALPPELQNANPLGIQRMLDGVFTRDPSGASLG